MKSLFFCGILLSLSLCSIAEEGVEEALNLKEIWNNITTKLCKADTTDDKTITALVECKKQLLADKLQNEKWKERKQKTYEKCGKPNESDVEGYTKVDLTKEDHKKLLMVACSEKMKTCLQDMFKQWKEKHANSSDKPKHKGHFTDDQKKQFKECTDKAFGGSR